MAPPVQNRPHKWRSAMVGVSSALSALVASAVTIAVVGLVGQSPARDAHAARELGRDGFDVALDAVLDRYVDPIDRGKLLASALKTLVSGLDIHSHYLTADERKILRERHASANAGLVVVLQRGNKAAGGASTAEIVAVMPGSPAQLAGLRAGDHVLRIAGRDVSYMLSQPEVDTLLCGREGESVSLWVQRSRDSEPMTVAVPLVQRFASEVAVTLSKTRPGPVAHVRIHAFRAGTGERVQRALQRLRERDQLAGIVLDLRGNPGGEIAEALIVADLFVAEGVLVRTRGRGGRVIREERAHPAGTDTKTPLVVLQDRHSASASELVAAALQAHGRARIVGERSYGKGTVQEVLGMDDGSLLTLTTARYYSPNDRTIDQQGVVPDVPIVLSEGSDARVNGDRGLDAAIAIVVVPNRR